VKLLFMGRRRGKTTKTIKWLLEGEQTNIFPYWSRVMLVANGAERVQLIDKFNLNPRQVFVWDDWKHAAGIDRSVDVAIDNADLILKQMMRGHEIAIITMTKAPTDEVEFTTS